jgi:CubicO group peptidase (beta-lactamase class C family)
VFQAMFTKHHEENHFSGVGLIKQGETVLFAGAFGLANRSFQIPNRLSTRFDTASITKLFTAVAVLQLIEQAKLSLQDKVIPLLKLPDTKISEDVSVYHLLTHTSGIGDDADEEAGESYEELWRDKPNYAIRETADFLPQFVHKEPNFAPGQGCRYNNVAYVLLGLIIEQLTGMKYRDYVVEHVFNKVGMPATGFFHKEGVDPDVAEGYVMVCDAAGRFEGWRKNIYSYPPIGSPDGGAYSTVADLDCFMRALRGGQILSKSMTDRMFSPQVIYRRYDDRIHKMGFGLEFITDLADDITVIRKDGANPGVACFLAYLPQQDITQIILANQDCDVWKISRELRAVL